ncbi:Zn-dependent alcohol dehydrogenase [Thermodesulfobacteriota bacterium]
MTTTKAAILNKYETPLSIEEVEYAKPGDGQVLVKLMASGVCHSDYHVIKGEWTQVPTPNILGHEGAGVVEQIGPGVTSVAPGDHVILSWRRNCGICEACQKGFPNLCVLQVDPQTQPKRGEEKINQFIGLGTFADYTVVTKENVVKIDNDIPFPQAALLGCGVMTGVGAAINTVNVEPGSSVAVFGCGGVGLNCIQGARISGAHPIIAVDMMDNKLELGKQFGATHTVNAGREDAVERIREITGGLGAHYAFEAIGLVEQPYHQSIECTRSRGVTVLVGHAPTDLKITISPRILIAEKTVIGSLYGTARPHVDFPRLLSLYKAGKLMLDELVSREYRLDQVNDAFDALAKGDVARSVLRFD